MTLTKMIFALLQIVGSLCMLLFGMKLLSDGIQKSAGKRLQSALHFMTGNRFLGLLTGCLLTMLIQSSGATTVMVVSFVNAGLVTLEQSVAVIFGANIGTTVTAWIVAVFGFDFQISAVAVPLFALGYILTIARKRRHESLGQAIMGFALLFIALGALSEAFSFNADQMAFLAAWQNLGFWSRPLAVLLGALLTALIHSSSATTAIVITMAYNGVLTWEFSAALVIGSNIGSTVDSVMAAFGSKTNARRAALVHVFFNCATAILALIFLPQLTRFVDWITPGQAHVSVTYHIAMLHTLFNLAGTVLFLPISSLIARLTVRLIPDKKEDIPEIYTFPFPEQAAYESATIPLVEARAEIQRMADLTVEMFDRLQHGFGDAQNFSGEPYNHLEKQEGYLDQMQEELTKYLLRCQNLGLDREQQSDLNTMIAVVTELEDMSDGCLTVGVFLKRMVEKELTIPDQDRERLMPYLGLVRQLLYFIYEHIGGRLDKDQLNFAQNLEDQIDEERQILKKVGRSRLESGGNVKAELLYIDMVRKIEKMGDNCFAIAETLTAQGRHVHTLKSSPAVKRRASSVNRISMAPQV